MLFQVALAGRTNVGKSSLFNRLCKSAPPRRGKHTEEDAANSAAPARTQPYSSRSQRKAIVANSDGVTRDLLCGVVPSAHGDFILIDSPGQMMDNEVLHKLMEEQARKAYIMADLLLFVCDGKEGLTAADERIATEIHASNKICILLVNKMDHNADEGTIADFYRFGFPVIGVSAKSSLGVKDLRNEIERQIAKKETAIGAEDNLPATTDADDEADDAANPTPKKAHIPAIALLGCPNVGKSTLANLLLKEERQLVHEKPGSTRDSVLLPFTMDKSTKEGTSKEDWMLIDTAGIRRKSRVNENLEQLMVTSAIHAIYDSDVVIYIVDATEGLRHQDSALLHLAERAGKGLVIAVNKADLLDEQQRKDLKGLLEWDLAFIDYAPCHFISAAKNKGIKELLKSVQLARRSAETSWDTTALNRVLQALLNNHPPPLRQGMRSNLRYANQIHDKPPHLVIHGKRLQQLPNGYKKYLQKSFSREMKLQGAPLKISYKTDDNPYGGSRQR